MNKERFNNAPVEEQIKYINGEMIVGVSLTNVCKSIEISRATIRNRFMKVGYVFDKEIKQYVKQIEEPIEGQIVVEDMIVPKTEKKKMGRPMREVKGKKHTIFIADEVWDSLQVQANEQNTSIATIINTILSRKL